MRRVTASPNHPSLHHIAAARTLHLIDVDNLRGDPLCTDTQSISNLFRSYPSVSWFADGDLVVVAAGCNAATYLQSRQRGRARAIAGGPAKTVPTWHCLMERSGPRTPLVSAGL